MVGQDEKLVILICNCKNSSGSPTKTPVFFFMCKLKIFCNNSNQTFKEWIRLLLFFIVLLPFL